MKHTTFFFIFMTINSITLGSQNQPRKQAITTTYVHINEEIVTLHNLYRQIIDNPRLNFTCRSPLEIIAVAHPNEKIIKFITEIKKTYHALSADNQHSLNNNPDVKLQNDLLKAIFNNQSDKVEQLLKKGAKTNLLVGADLNLIDAYSIVQAYNNDQNKITHCLKIARLLLNPPSNSSHSYPEKVKPTGCY